MAEVLSSLRDKKEVELICADNGLRLSLLKEFFYFRSQGHNNKETAQKLGVHRITAQRYADTLRKLKESEFKKLYNLVMGGESDEEEN